ncbi:nuclear pore complex protein Nup98-Nup96 isoform X5 [Rhizophagus clarus]|uniref:Nuclear pore complex protein Nup98-Nup96 isoform X5 n=1 Tax=Rhizophagus clarus TaxID=94130 RepID=A0A8H3LWM2_9GLOM|nr:nuclear pore complex protein Nup98-Nup96 isoform X5 [Rhizophagus clarus]
MNSQQGFGFNQNFPFGKSPFQNLVTTTSTNQPFGNWQSTGFGQQTQTTFGGFGQPGPSTAFGGFAQPQTSFGFGPSSGNGFGFQGPQPGPSSGFNTQQNAVPFGIPGPSSVTTQGTTPSVNIDPRLTGTREPKFEPVKDNEPTGIQIFQSITAMKEYRKWSTEELRLYDYELNRRPGVQQPQITRPAQSVVPTINTTTTMPYQFPQQQPQQQPFFQQQFPQPQQPQPFLQQPFAQPQNVQTPFVQQFTQQPPTTQSQLPFQQPPTTIGALNPFNYQYTGSLYFRLHGTNNPPPLVFETKLKPKVDKGKEFQSQLQLGITTGPLSAISNLSSFVGAIGDTSKTSGENQIPKSTALVPTFPTPSALQTTTITQTSSILTNTTPAISTAVVTTKPAITVGLTKPSDIGLSITNEQPKEDSDDEREFLTEKKTRTTPLPEEYEKVFTEADYPRRKRREPIYGDGILTKDDIKEPTWGYEKSYRKIVPKINNIGNSENLLEQLKIKDKPVTTSKHLTNTTEANKKKVPGSEVPPESDVEARLVYELFLKPRRDGPYAYRGENDGTWSPLYGDGRDEKPKLKPLKWKKQQYYKEYVKDVKRTRFPITEERYEAPSWWDKYPYKPVPKELVKDMDQYDHSQEAFAEDIVIKMGLRPDPPKVQIDALNRQVSVKIIRVQKKPAEWTETKMVTEPCNCCGTMVQKSKEEKMFFHKLDNPLIGGFESQPLNQPWVFVYAALPGEFEDRTPTYIELLNKYKSGIPQRNMYILDEPPRMPRVDLSNIIEGEIEFSKIVKEDVHKICHQDKKCDCPYAKKEPEVKQTPSIPRSHFYCYERLGKKPRENKPTTFEMIHGYQPFSKQKIQETQENKPTKQHRILVPPQDL